MQEATENSVNVDKLVDDFKLVVQDAEGLIKATAGEVGATLTDSTRDARDRLSRSLESAKSSYHALEAKAVAGARATDKLIREHPYESLGIAVGAGMLLGLILGRR